MIKWLLARCGYVKVPCNLIALSERQENYLQQAIIIFSSYSHIIKVKLFVEQLKIMLRTQEMITKFLKTGKN